MIDLRTLGSIGLRAGDGRELRSILAQPKRTALLVYLALARPRGFHRRDTLLALFWPERDEAHARNALRQSVHFLRRSLGKGVLEGRGDDELGIARARLRCDAVEFEAALDQGRTEEALELYRGPLLEGLHVGDAAHELEEWLESERARLRRRAVDGALELAAREQSAGNVTGAVHWTRRAAALEPHDEEMLRRLVTVLDGSGDRAGALRAYAAFARGLDDAYALEPAPETVALIERIRARTGRAAEAGSPPQPAAEAAGFLAPAEYIGLPAAEPAAPAPAMAAALRRRPPGPSSRLPRRAAVWLSAIAAAAVVLLGAVSALRRGAPAAAPASIRTVVLGDMEGPDATLALAIREALRVELESDPAIRVLGGASARAALELMMLPPETPLTTPVMLVLAQRQGVRLGISGSASPLGTGAQLVVRVIDTRTGAVLASVSERPRAADDVIPAVARLASAVRAEVTGAVADDGRPLPALSTASLPALRNYALARQALARLDRDAAIRLGEAALVHDSMFALAHYLVADQLWYVDQQRHSDEHMRRALELSSTLPPRERLIVQARYEQLVRDRPDSALVYWGLLAESYPDEALAYEGMRWVYRSLGQTSRMADASEKAYERDPTWLRPYLNDRIRALMIVDADTAAAFAFARSFADRPGAVQQVRYLRALMAEDWQDALDHIGGYSAYYRHFLLVAMRRLENAALELPAVRTMDLQHAPKALLLHARALIEAGEPRPEARALTLEALEWVVAADLSPPAYARLAELVADAAARMDDPATATAARRLIVAKDRGRGLRSYDSALLMIDACLAFAAGRMAESADLAEQARATMFYGRSTATVLLLEADARAARGQHARADSLYRLILRRNGFPDGDPETLALVRTFARERRQALNGS